MSWENKCTVKMLGLRKFGRPDQPSFSGINKNMKVIKEIASYNKVVGTQPHDQEG
jgi:hypothetical protein